MINLKEIKKLYQKKYRIKNGLFIVEGIKSVKTFLNSTFELDILISTENTPFKNHQFPSKTISEKQFQQISRLQNPEGLLAVFKIPSTSTPLLQKGLIVALDGVKDPGNMGTIIRICHWFGIKHIICNKNTVDTYNPKIVQASMGSLAFVKVHHTALDIFLKNVQLPILGADTKGTSLYETTLPKEGVIVMGNESHGISKTIKDLCGKLICLPNFSKNTSCDSLNVAAATGVILSYIRAPYSK